MKKIGEYTVRGQITEGTDFTQKIQLFDGRFDTGYKLIKFVIAGSRADDSSSDCVAKVMTENIGTSADFWNWNDAREIGWASTDHRTADGVQKVFSEVDPENLVVEDLFITAQSRSSSNPQINYLMTLEKYDISEYKGVLAMIKNNGQSF